MGYDEFGGWGRYVSVAERRAKALRHADKLKKQGRALVPVEIIGNKIATTFWGKAWCDHLESYSDYANRLPRGRTYVRNGSVIDLQIEPGQVKALVMGSSLYDVTVTIQALAADRWQALVGECAGHIGSLVELLQGKLSKGVLGILVDRDRGLFPGPREIGMRCSCPDAAVMCKHVAAVLYGVGKRLDERPELFFTLRRVDQAELIARATDTTRLGQKAPTTNRRLAAADLSSVFGIDLDPGRPDEGVAPAVPSAPARTQKGHGRETAASRREGAARKAGGTSGKVSLTKAAKTVKAAKGMAAKGKAAKGKAAKGKAAKGTAAKGMAAKGTAGGPVAAQKAKTGFKKASSAAASGAKVRGGARGGPQRGKKPT
ncbi:MAG TPA: hypothetical protein VH877_27400 [Polyangia bacterium]|jgi:uncharacterized Zn finger protein|nr:hypothetical protein [Polyangia bacterium]